MTMGWFEVILWTVVALGAIVFLEWLGRGGVM